MNSLLQLLLLRTTLTMHFLRQQVLLGSMLGLDCTAKESDLDSTRMVEKALLKKAALPGKALLSAISGCPIALSVLAYGESCVITIRSQFLPS